MKRTGGNWNPGERNIYFIASDTDTLREGLQTHPYILCAINEITNEKELAWLVDAAKNPNVRLFIDSGVFALANGHAVAHDITMDEALALAPTDIDGFDALYKQYCSIIETLGDLVWGYIEIDQGGRENKKITRAKLEAKGFRPIPVYHPFNDGWDYFDELASQYDRICFGNIVQADVETRKRLLATAWERKRKYPHLWIHLLGLSVNERLNAYPIDSCDSSAWLMHVRWSDRFHAVTAGKAMGMIGHNVARDRSNCYACRCPRNGELPGGSAAEPGLLMAYTINEIFCSVQGEGLRSGTLNHFVRFTACNLTCKVETHGFDCDTEFASGRKMTAQDILAELRTLNAKCKSVIFTGGEPLLQLDSELSALLKSEGYYRAIETNGSKALPDGVDLDWITCSPKVAEHAVRLEHASEVKYVRGHGQGIPKPACHADHKLLSPAFNGMELDRRALDWCIRLVHENPDWRLSLQSHKFIHVR